jgi:HD-like signal output (HDOD) protein
MRGRVPSLQLAVTVVGFPTVRTMATVALTDLDDESRLPEDFWTVTTSLALAASALAPRFGERPQDGLCIGLLAQMGAALLHHNDPEGYAELCAEEPAFIVSVEPTGTVSRRPDRRSAAATQMRMSPWRR